MTTAVTILLWKQFKFYISISEFENILQEIGLSDEQIAMSVMTAETFGNGALDFTFDDMEKLLGRTPVGLDTFIKQFVE